MLLFALLFGCSDIGITEVKEPSVIVAPSLIEFGHLESGLESDIRRITITNGGTADLVVDRLEASGDNFWIDESGFVVASGEWHQIEVSYVPQTFEHNEGYVDIYLEGDDEPSEGVWLDGYGDAPVITMTPSEHDFGNPLLGCEPVQEIQIQNDGNINLEITSIDIMQSVPPEISIDFGSLPDFPWEIVPGGRLAFYANYIPMDEVGDLTSFDVNSNDPLNPVIEAFAEGNATMSNEQIQTWIQKSSLVVDIIWIIDNSGSMSPYQMMLAQNMEAFMNIFLGYTPDFKMMFITTDSAVIVGDTLDSSTANPVVDSSVIINQIGIMGSGNEEGLSHFYECISPGGQCLMELRHDAQLIAIFVSDEPDYSPISVTDVINLVDSLRPGAFSPYAIIGEVPQGCNSGGWPAQPGLGYYDLIQSYSSQWWSICDTDWGTQMEEIAQSVSLKTRFHLNEEDPNIDTIMVWVNGQIKNDWEYDEGDNAVVFGFEDAPQPGDTVEIEYSIWGCGGQ